MNRSKTLVMLLMVFLCSTIFLSLTACMYFLSTNAQELFSQILSPFINRAQTSSQFINRAQTSSQFNYVIIDDNGPTNIWQKSVGDINGDGLVDLIAGGNAGGGLVWYQNPDWIKHTISSKPRHSTDAEVADVDKDGDNDILSLTTSEIRWYENPNWTVHTIDKRTLHDIEISDFDADGDVDIVARDQGEFGHHGDELHFYRQDSPSVWTHRSVSIANGEGLHVADLDNDGDLDVVIGGSWFENNRDIINAPWTEHVYTTSWTHGNAFVSSGDVNGDGRLDIILSPAELAGETYRISWFEAPTNAKSENWTEHIVEDNVEAVHHFVGAADMNNDGELDIAAAEMRQGDNPDEVKIYINEGQGQAWQKQVIATTGSHSMRIVDINNDGDMDLYGANWQGQTVELWENLICSSTLSSWERHVVDSAKPWQTVFITSADINGDNQPDIITGGWWYQNPGSPNLPWERHTIGSPLNNMSAVYDFDGDDDMDILGTKGQAPIGSTPNSATFVWARNEGNGVFTILENIQEGDGDFLQGVAAEHFQTDTSLDIMLSWHTANKGIQKLVVPSNPSLDMWTWEQISSTSQDEALSAGDIDRDGDIDLLLGTKWLRNDEKSWTPHTLNNTNGKPDRNRLADINGDGRVDAIVGFEAISVPGKLAWYEQGDLSTDIWTEHLIATIVGPMSLDVVDMDQDGDLDVVAGEHNLSDSSTAKLYVFENVDGQGARWAEHIVYTGDEHHDGTQAVDIDGDGDIDIISIGWGHDQVLIYENKAPKGCLLTQ